MATAYDTANIIIPKSAGYKAGSLYGWNPQGGSLVDFAVTRAGATATRVNEAGLIESVAANVPRIDWAEGGSCPSLLVEPQRTNYVNYSDGVTANYGGFGFSDQANTFGIGLTNEIVIPDNSRLDLRLGATAPSASDYNLSFYFKVGSGDIPNYGNDTSDDFYVQIAGSIIDTSEVEITAVPNKSGIYKLVATNTGVSPVLNDNRIVTNFTGQSTKTIYASGFQLEIGSYATSYIPTAGTTETRNADVIQKTGISSLLGQNAGSLYLDALWFEDGRGFELALDSNTYFSIFVSVSPQFTIRAEVSGSIQFNAGVLSGFTTNTYYKLLGRFDGSTAELHKDGAQITSSITGANFTSSNLSQFNFKLSDFGGLPFYGRLRAAAVYPYKLDATESNNLTTP